ncbi:hypothetical protein HPB51_007824 [Rhipicephalus microplus]|uniref:Uncharacterized protein n=1 Tax=Rhipicephalus microplus TaxID=6941 RepID=A0A9J6F083_RHIMP|nr:hypothetical protein HPB51_007824 [Rhipicephalus microplus]
MPRILPILDTGATLESYLSITPVEESPWLFSSLLAILHPEGLACHPKKLLRALQVANPPHDLVAHRIRSIIRRRHREAPFHVAIGELQNFTATFVSKERWVNPISKYTNDTYSEEDNIIVIQPALNVLVDILNSTVGENGLRYLVAWSMYRQLLSPGYLPRTTYHGHASLTCCGFKASCARGHAELSGYGHDFQRRCLAGTRPVMVPTLQAAAWSAVRATRGCWGTGMSSSGDVRPGRGYGGGAYPLIGRLVYHADNVI